MKFAIFLKSAPTFYKFLLRFLYINKTLGLNNSKTKTAMKAKLLVFLSYGIM